MRQTASPLAVWAGIVLLYVVWGSTYLGIKIAIGSIPPLLMTGMRFVPAGVLLASAVALRNRRTFRRPTAAGVRDAAVVGICLIGGGMGLVSWGEQTVSSGIAALLIGLMPMWLAIFGRAVFGDRLPRRAVVGTVVGITGIAILAWPAGGPGQVDPTGLMALLVSPMSWTVGSLYAARRAVLPAPALFATGLEMAAGGTVVLLVGLLTGEAAGFDPGAVTPASWGALAYLLVIGSLVAFSTYAWLIGVAPLARVATYAYVNPVVAVILGWLVLGEPLTYRTLVAAAVIVTGVVLIVSSKGRGPATHREAVGSAGLSDTA
jgi:drug/metabolite transporter (DMT)-like permease